MQCMDRCIETRLLALTSPPKSARFVSLPQAHSPSAKQLELREARLSRLARRSLPSRDDCSFVGDAHAHIAAQWSDLRALQGCRNSAAAIGAPQRYKRR
jgi:hypothetical protein